MTGGLRRTVTPSEVVGATPPREVRPVSLAIRDYLRRNHNEARGLVLAVSGGADSLALAVAAADHAERMGIPYTAAIVDHGLRPESAEEALLVEGRLRAAGLAEVVILGGQFGEPEVTHPLEGEAREFRHRLLDQYALSWAGQAGLESVEILYGHTMDDQAETVLMRLGRGASPRALAAIREHISTGTLSPRLYRGRPLLAVRRGDTEGFCRALGLEWVDDPSNSPEGTWLNVDGLPLPRTALRHSALPALREALGQDPVPALARVARMLGEDEDLLADLARRELASLREGANLELAPLADLPAALRRRVLILLWEDVAEGMITAEQVEAVDQLVTADRSGPRSPTGKCIALPGGWQARRTRETLVFERI